MPQFDFSQIQTPSAPPPMTSDNAAKMRELYPDEAAAPKFDFSKVQAPKFDFAKVKPPEKPSLVKAGLEGAAAPFEPIVRRFKDAATEIGAAESEKVVPARIENPRTGLPMNPAMDVTKPLRVAGAMGMATPAAVLAGAGGEAAETTAARAAGVPEAKAKELGRDTGDLTALAGAPAGKHIFEPKVKTPPEPKPEPKSEPEIKTPFVQSPEQVSKIFSSDHPSASTKPVTSVQGVSDRLYQHRNSTRADYKEFAGWAKQFKAVPKEFWQKALDHLDDPKAVPLSPQEQLIFDRSIKPMQEEIETDRAYIKKSGLDPNKLEDEAGSLGGAIRQRKGMNTPLDRMTGTKSVPPESGRTVSRSAGTFKGRSMMALTKDGKRAVVHIDPEGQIFDAAKRGDPIGRIDPETGQPETGGKISDATRKEIEQATGGKVAYHDNAFGVYGTTLLQTRRAVRAVKLLNEIKKAPEFKEVARAPYTKGDVPKGWREIPNAPEFKGWRFEPRYAEEIEDFIGGMKRDEGALSKLDKLNRFSLSTLFWLNPIHAYNITDAFLVTKGAGALVKDLPGATGDLLKSIKSVATRDKYNMAQTRSGIPMPGLDTAGEEFRRMTLDIMGVKARQDPQNFLQFIKRFGFDKPADFFKRVGEVSHKAVFSYQDVLQQTLERGYMRKGMSQAEATEKVAKTFMNYRTPARVMDQRWMGQALQGQAWLDFPKYSYGRLKGMYKILEGSAKLDPHAIDQLLTIAVLYEFGRHAMDPLIQQYTGNPNAQFGSFGYNLFPDLVEKTMQGRRTLGQDAQSLGSPGYMVQGLDMLRGVNPYLAKSVSVPGETPKEVGLDYASQIANKLSPVQRWGQVARGSVTPEEQLLEQLGVKFPADMPRSVRRDLRSRERYGSQIEQELGQ